MRQRRPEQYSDTETADFAPLDRDLFEYRLENITHRSDEKVFEHFARALMQREICPNLIPQTGPTGGGDSKVDSETYPVAPEIAERWFEGLPDAGRERWAFAFSAKKDWKPKVKTDIEKIAKTARGYVKAFFVSNQFIRDKERAEVEDALSREHGLTVRIFDRSWIVATIFERKLFELAATTLGFNAPEAVRTARTGPGDAARQARLKELERLIAEANETTELDYQIAEHGLGAAIVARELELPRAEIEGRFDRAERLARRAGSPQQLFRVLYQRAWTYCYWFDDFAGLNRLYPSIEEIALASDEADDVERLANLWTTIAAGVRSGQFSADVAQMDQRTDRLKAHVRKLAGDSKRPNNAAHASAILISCEVSENCLEPEVACDRLVKLVTLMEGSERLGGFPFRKYCDLFEMMGELLGGFGAYDEAFERLVPVMERRGAEALAGRALLKRGLQKIDGDACYDAIRLLGRAFPKLGKEELLEEFITCRAAIGEAYRRVGLYWAARGSLLAAAASALKDANQVGLLNRPSFHRLNRLAWCELALGRLPRVLCVIELARIIASHLDFDEEEADGLRDEFNGQDTILGILLMRATKDQLPLLGRLLPALEAIDAHSAAAALLFTLGHLDALREKGYIPMEEADASISDMFERLVHHQDEIPLPKYPDLFEKTETILRSPALGCEWQITAPTSPTGIAVAEGLMAFIEALFATSLLRDAVPIHQRIRVEVSVTPRTSDGGSRLTLLPGKDSNPFNVEFTDDYDCRDENRTGVMLALLERAVPQLLANVLYVPDPKAYLDRLCKEEDAVTRAVAAAQSFMFVDDVEPEDRATTMAAWLDEGDCLQPLRDVPLSVQFSRGDEKRASAAIRPGQGEPPEIFTKPEAMSHSQRKVVSVINTRLWAIAKWRGTAFGTYGARPFLGLIFENEQAAESIFAEWRSDFGSSDDNDEIRISLITGISLKAPLRYRMHITSGACARTNGSGGGREQTFIIVSKKNTMEPASSKNLDYFVESYRAGAEYELVPVVLVNNEPKVRFDLALIKRHLVIRPAWQVSEHDPDGIAIEPDDDPIIPAGVTNPPVEKVLARRRASANRSARA
jgi:hypothetical protein